MGRSGCAVHVFRSIPRTDIPPLLALTGALAACYLTTQACAYLANFAWFTRIFIPLGKNSLVILALHQSVALRLTHWFGLHASITLPAAILVPLLIALALQKAGWLSQWLFLGKPPETLREHCRARRSAPGFP